MSLDYFGFLSIYDGQRSRQLVLTSEDFFLNDAKDKDMKTEGRVMPVLKSVLERVEKEQK